MAGPAGRPALPPGPAEESTMNRHWPWTRQADPDRLEAGSLGKDSPAPGCWGYREILLLLAVGALAQRLASLAAVLIAELLGVTEIEEAQALLQRDARVAVAAQIVAWIPPMAYVVLIVSVRYRLPLREGLNWTKPAGSARSYIRTGVLLGFASLLVSIAMGDAGQQSPMRELFADREHLWILAAFGVLAAPVLEEVVFRGFLFAAFERAHGPWAALVVTSTLFAVLHGAQYGWQWQRLVVLAAIGSALGAVRMQSGSAKASTIVHAAYNGLLFLAVISFFSGVG